MRLEEIRQCLGSLPEGLDRGPRVERMLELLHVQKEKVAREQANLARLEQDINDTLDKVTRCLRCKAEQCQEECPSYGQVL